MKKIKLLVLCMLVISILGCSVNVFAATHTVTKSNKYVTVKLEYNSYIDKQGRKLVNNGRIVSVKGNHGPGFLYLWEFVPKNSYLRRIDGGRTYMVGVDGAVVNFTSTGKYSRNETTSIEFYYQ